MRRFFRSSEYLISTMRKDPQQQSGPLESWRRAFYTSELKRVPGKLAMWSNFIDGRLLSTKPEQVQQLTVRLQALTFRLLELLNARRDIQADQLVQELDVEELRKDIQAWQGSMQDTFQRLSEDPAFGDSEVFRAKLGEIVGHLEVRVKEILDVKAKGLLSPEDDANIYRLLGAYRSLSEAMGDYIASNETIHWARWKEARF